MMDFTTFDSECWDSTPFQEKFIQSYFKNPKISKKESINQNGKSYPSNSSFGMKIKNRAKKLKKQSELSDDTSKTSCAQAEDGIMNVPESSKRKLDKSTQNIFKKFKKSIVPESEKIFKNDLLEKSKFDSKCSEVGFGCDNSSKHIKKMKKRNLSYQSKKELLISNDPIEKHLVETGLQILEKEQEMKHLHKNFQKFSKITAEANGSAASIKQQKNEKAVFHSTKMCSQMNAVGDHPIKRSNKFPNTEKSTSFRLKAQEKLQAAKFRYLNEKLYTTSGKEAYEYFQTNVKEYEDYHVGYNLQVMKWPINPVDVFIKDLYKIKENAVIADLGCGDAKIAQTFPARIVHSFDLIALRPCVTSCDISKVPLSNECVDIAIFCLSLMGTNVKDYLIEAHRILKLGGILKIAEVESRIADIEAFVKNLKHFGFSLQKKDVEQKIFIFFDLKKVKRKLKRFNLPNIALKACLYKKR